MALPSESRFGPVREGLSCAILARDLQKPIVIGRGGEMIKQIGTAARQEIEKFFHSRVYLDLRVAVREQWRYPHHRELFPRYTGLPFDPVAPGLVAADLTIQLVLNPERAARLISQQAYDPGLPSLGAVIARLVAATFGDKPANNYELLVNQAVERALVERLMTLAGDAPMPQVRAVATASLRSLRSRTQSVVGADAAHARLIAADITRCLERPFEPAKPIAAPEIPPGAPIGALEEAWRSVDEDWCSLPAVQRGRGFFPPLMP